MDLKHHHGLLKSLPGDGVTRVRYWNKTSRIKPRWPSWVKREDRSRLRRMVERARIYPRDSTSGVRVLLELAGNFRKKKLLHCHDPFHHWSTALGLNILDFIGGGWENDKPLHHVAQAAWEELGVRAERWRRGKDLEEYPRQVRSTQEPEFKPQGLVWGYTKRWLRKEAVGLDEMVEAYRQAAYFFSALLEIVDT